MRFDILTIFPGILESYFNESIIKRARQQKLLEINEYDIRAHTTDKHRTVDDRPYGGGAGMIMKVEPIYKTLQKIKAIKPEAESHKKIRSKVRIVLLAANGKQFTQNDAKRLSKYDRLVFICGRYEGVDERVTKFIDEKISIGPYVLTGGELPAAVIIDAVARHIPRVLGNKESLVEESFTDSEGEYPQYTRPEIFKKMKVPKILMSGDHKKIEEWRKRKSK